MSDEVSRRLEEAAGAHARAANEGADISLVTASIIGKARRRRRVTGALTVAAAVVGVLAVGGGSFAVMSTLRGGDVGPATHAEVPSWGPSSVAATTSPPTTASEPAPLAIADYPPLAPSRGAGFPAAHEMQAWVWAYVGQGWSLQSFSASAGVYSSTSPTTSGAVIYLVGPDGEKFDLQELAPEYSQGLRVVSWQAGARTAHIVWTGDHEAGVPSGGAEIDLTTGEILPIVFATPWGVSSTVAPVAVSAAGNELWEAWLGRHVRFYRYGAASGWTVATVNELDGVDDLDANARWRLAASDGDTSIATRPDGATVLFEQRAAGGTVGAPTQIAVYDLDAADYAKADVTEQLGGDCVAKAWLDAGSVQYVCATTKITHVVQLPLAPAFDNAAGASAYPRLDPIADTTVVSRSGYVGYGQAPRQ
ncbi:hypothetical protein [Demequina lutea]|uniref:Putative low-complexity protein n=1 Tax=Demequina lutea TaxID=431489 RepID=A0A7Y9Z8S6_9MICO|nr:hypothetical protein [Demequina lutea]NYI40068.1 putative low-complexity protein [Demequina lutea]